jgi:8-oxo-dGTP diphosphatase
MSDKLEEKHVVTCFLESDGEVLILRRSQQVGTYQGRWAGVSGYMEKSDDEQALTEIGEETSLTTADITLIKKGKPLEIDDRALGVRWVVHPYLFAIKDRGKIKTDWEHNELKWIKPVEIADYPTVPNLKETLERVLSREGEDV